MEALKVLEVATEHSVLKVCQTLQISRSNFYQSQERAEARKTKDAPVAKAIKEIQQHPFKKS